MKTQLWKAKQRQAAGAKLVRSVLKPGQTGQPEKDAAYAALRHIDYSDNEAREIIRDRLRELRGDEPKSEPD